MANFTDQCAVGKPPSPLQKYTHKSIVPILYINMETIFIISKFLCTIIAQ